MIDQIKEVLEKATSGPWKFEKVEGGYSTDEGRFVGVDESIICHFGDSETYYPSEGSAPTGYDMELIANAPTWLQHLLDENERLKSIDERECTIAVRLKKEHAAMKAALEWITINTHKENQTTIKMFGVKVLSTLSKEGPE